MRGKRKALSGWVARSAGNTDVTLQNGGPLAYIVLRRLIIIRTKYEDKKNEK